MDEFTRDICFAAGEAQIRPWADRMIVEFGYRIVQSPEGGLAAERGSRGETAFRGRGAGPNHFLSTPFAYIIEPNGRSVLRIVCRRSPASRWKLHPPLGTSALTETLAFEQLTRAIRLLAEARGIDAWFVDRPSTPEEFAGQVAG